MNNFADIVALFDKHREALLSTQLKNDVRLVAFAPGQVTLKLTAALPRDFTARVAECLTKLTGAPWKILVSSEEGAPSLYEQEQARKREQVEKIAAKPLVANMLEQFPGATIVNVKEDIPA